MADDGCFFRLIFCHAGPAINCGAGVHDKHRRLDVATDTASGADLDTAFANNASEDLSVDFQFTGFDVGMHDGMWTNDKAIVGRDGAVEGAIDPQRAGKLE